VVEGEVAFESTLPSHVGEGSALRRTFLRRETMATTETVGRNNYFGEEEVLAGTNRTQNAKCASIDCLLLTITVGRLERLVAVPEFRRTLELSAALKQ
jgi:CRP-like cAMP-binding protein